MRQTTVVAPLALKYSHRKHGESRPSPSSLDKIFFLETDKYPIADDDVIENLDPDLVSRLNQLLLLPECPLRSAVGHPTGDYGQG